MTETDRQGQAPTLDLPEVVSDGPGLQQAAEDELTGPLQLRVDGGVHVSQTGVEDVGARGETNHELGGEGILDLMVMRRVVSFIIHDFLQQILGEERHGGDAFFPVIKIEFQKRDSDCQCMRVCVCVIGMNSSYSNFKLSPPNVSREAALTAHAPQVLRVLLSIRECAVQQDAQQSAQHASLEVLVASANSAAAPNTTRDR